MSYRKKPEEVRLIQEGGRLMGQILETVVGQVRPGVSFATLDREAERLILNVGGIPAFKGYRASRGDVPFSGTICASRNDEVVHGVPTEDKILQSGDLFTIDIGMQWPANSGKGKNGHGFFTDTATTVSVGEPNKEVKKLIEVTKEALEVGIRAALPGKSVADIGRAIEVYIKSQGDYGIVRDLSGHGVGHAVHEDPWVPNYYVRDLENWILEPGVVLALEPMVTLGGIGVESLADGWTIVTKDHSLAAHTEHTIVITSGEPIVVTRRPSE